MISSKNSLPNNKAILILIAILGAISGCTTIEDSDTRVTKEVPANVANLSIAVFPLYNLSAAPAPLRDIQQALVHSLVKRGIHAVAEEVLGRWMVDNRMRHVGGIDQYTAQNLRQSLGVQAVLITSLELYSDQPPPKIALVSRLVSTGDDMAVWWADGIGLAGDDHPGILGLSLIEDPKDLVDKAVASLSASLVRHLSEKSRGRYAGKRRSRFRPRFVHSDAVIVPGASHEVAIIPFFNVSERKHAGEIVALHFVAGMSELEGFAVVEPGIVRQALLGLRIIMADGLSLAYGDLIFRKLDVDLILTGKVLAYDDYQGPMGKPRVDFSALLIERKTRKVVWTCKSHNEGDDGVFFFDVGKVNTAHAMASEMVRLAVDTIGKAGEAGD